MMPLPQRHHIPQASNTLRYNSMWLKLGLIIVISINLTIHCSVLTSVVGCVLFCQHRNTQVLYESICDLKFLAEVAATMAAAVVPWLPGPGAEA
jgi:hypothetical protein